MLSQYLIFFFTGYFLVVSILFPPLTPWLFDDCCSMGKVQPSVAFLVNYVCRAGGTSDIYIYIWLYIASGLSTLAGQ